MMPSRRCLSVVVLSVLGCQNQNMSTGELVEPPRDGGAADTPANAPSADARAVDAGMDRGGDEVGCPAEAPMATAYPFTPISCPSAASAARLRCPYLLTSGPLAGCRAEYSCTCVSSQTLAPPTCTWIPHTGFQCPDAGAPADARSDRSTASRPQGQVYAVP
jgi:hypothetical protein